MILHAFEQSFNGFVAEIVGPITGGERIGLVNKEDTAKRFLDDFLGLQRGLAYETGDQSGAVDFDELAF